MATRKFSLSALIRRRHSFFIFYHSPISSSLSSSNSNSPPSLMEPLQFMNASNRYLTTHSFFRYGGCGYGVHWSGGFSTPHNLCASPTYRSFSTSNDSEFDGTKFEGEKLSEPGFFDYNDGGGGDTGIVDVGVAAGNAIGDGGGGGCEEAILPVSCLIRFLDEFHDLTGLPWWMVIVISTLALRVAILPVLLLQLSKLKRSVELAPQLPPPLPPPFSGKSWIEQYKRFRNKRKEIGCPSWLWILAYPSVQIPCFILGTTSIRQMALDHYSGFDCGGILWFRNLTELPHGASGVIFPLLVAGLYLVNVMISVNRSSFGSFPGVLGLLAKYYRFYLQSLTLPILIGAFYLPQGSLVYWAANSSITLIQQLVLKHPHVRKKLGLPDNLVREDSGKSRELNGLEATFTVPMGKRTISDLSLLELINLSIKHLSKGEQDKAVQLLRLALKKDPGYIRALILMGQLALQNEQLVEAIEYLERAITELLSNGQPTEVEEVDHLILASTWVCVAHAKQGKVAEGIVYLERIANMKEPEDPTCKRHYLDGLFILSSALANLGRDTEAAKYLRILNTHDPVYDAFLKQLEGGGDNFAEDLVNSRRKDY